MNVMINLYESMELRKDRAHDLTISNETHFQLLYGASFYQMTSGSNIKSCNK